jgi:ABC-2 type transport system permease protein
MWQIIVSLITGVIGSWICLWFSAKVFRIGLLMYGKPPNLATLIKWARMA